MAECKLKWLLLVLVLGACVAGAQNVRVDNVAFSSLLPPNSPFISQPLITVCTSVGAGLPCNTPVSGLCVSATDTTCNSPAQFTGDNLGNFGFWIQPGKYVVTVTKAGFSGYSTTYTLACQPATNCTTTGNNTHSGTETFNGLASITGALTAGSTTITTRSRDCRIDGTLDPTGVADAAATINTCIANAKTNNQAIVQLPCGNFNISSANINFTNLRGMSLYGCGSYFFQGPSLSVPQSTVLWCNRGTTACLETEGSGGYQLLNFSIQLAGQNITTPTSIGILQGRDNAGGGGGGNPNCVSETWLIQNVSIIDISAGGNYALNGSRGYVGIYNVGAENGQYSNVNILAGIPLVLSQTDVIAPTGLYQTLQTGCGTSMTAVSGDNNVFIANPATQATPLIEADQASTIHFVGTELLGGNAAVLFKTGGSANWLLTGKMEQQAATAYVIRGTVPVNNSHFILSVPSTLTAVMNPEANSLTFDSDIFEIEDANPFPFITNTATGTTIRNGMIKISGTTSASNTLIQGTDIYAKNTTRANITFGTGSFYPLHDSLESGNNFVGQILGGLGSAANPTYSFTGQAGDGWWDNGGGVLDWSIGQVAQGFLDGTGVHVNANAGYCITSNPAILAASCDTFASRTSANTWGLGNAIGATNGFVKTAQTLQVTGSNFTTSSASLVAVTGLTFTAPASAATNWSFKCDLIYSQATAAAANLFGIITTQTAPTNLQVWGYVDTNNTGTTVKNNAKITTATSTTVITATPSAFGAIGTNADMFEATIKGTLEAPSNASPSQVAIAVATGNASDALTIYRGSACWWY